MRLQRDQQPGGTRGWSGHMAGESRTGEGTAWTQKAATAHKACSSSISASCRLTAGLSLGLLSSTPLGMLSLLCHEGLPCLGDARHTEHNAGGTQAFGTLHCWLAYHHVGKRRLTGPKPLACDSACSSGSHIAGAFRGHTEKCTLPWLWEPRLASCARDPGSAQNMLVLELPQEVSAARWI